MKVKYLAIAVVLIVVVVAAAALLMGTTAAPAREIKVALSLDAGATIPGFSHTSYLALQAVETQFGVETAYSEYVAFADAQRDLETFAANGYDLVWGSGGQYADAAVAAAAKYPDTYFMTTGTTTAATNLRPYNPPWEQITYLAGVLAGRMTQSDQIGIINGGEFPVIVMLTNSAIEGIKSVNPDAEVTVSYVGTFTDPVKGRDFATTMMQSGVDVFISWAGFSSTGIFEAVRGSSDVYVIAEHQDYYEMGTDVSIASYMLNFTPFAVETVQDIINGNFTGVLKTPGIAEGVLDFIDISESKVPQDVRDEVAAVRQSIIDGSFTAPAIWPT